MCCVKIRAIGVVMVCYAVVDQGFPRGVCTLQRWMWKLIIWPMFSKKNAWNWKNLDWGRPWRLLDPPMKIVLKRSHWPRHTDSRILWNQFQSLSRTDLVNEPYAEIDLFCYVRRDYGELTSYFFIEYYVYIRPCIAELRENKIYDKTVAVISFKKYQPEIPDVLCN